MPQPQQLITVSRLSAFRRCTQYHHLRYEELITPVTDTEGVRSWGSAMHEALEAWWLAFKASREPDESRVDFEERMLSAALSKLDEAKLLGIFDKAKARAMMIAYHLRWKDEAVVCLAVERQFEMPLANPDSKSVSRLFLVGGKIDVIVMRISDGSIWCMEHKTTSAGVEPGGAYWQRLRVDAQISTYLDGAKAAGFDVVGCIYDVIQRPGEKPKKATPVEDRRFTAGKGCKVCGGTHGGKGGVQRGRGYLTTDHVWDHTDGEPSDHVPQCMGCLRLSVDAGPECTKPVPCGDCNGTGYLVGDEPRLHLNQREIDETPEEFFERVAENIATRPDEYMLRGDVVRTSDEMTLARREMWRSAKLLRVAQREELHVRNPDACAKFGTLCEMFALCSGEADVDGSRYKRATSAHPELAPADPFA